MVCISPNSAGSMLPCRHGGLTDVVGVADLEHVDGDAVVVDTLGRRVDAGESDESAASVVVFPFGGLTRAFAAVPSVVV